MEEKIIDPDKTVYELCAKDPQIQSLLAEAGFKDILSPGMLNTAGRFMTIRKGMAFKGINPEQISRAFCEHGYRLKEASL